MKLPVFVLTILFVPCFETAEDGESYALTDKYHVRYVTEFFNLERGYAPAEMMMMIVSLCLRLYHAFVAHVYSLNL